MLFILDKNLKIVDTLSNDGELGVTAPFFDDEYKQFLETGAETFSFSTMANIVEAQHIVVGNYVAFVYRNETKLFHITEVEEVHEQEFIKTVYCEVTGIELINEIVRPMTINSCNVSRLLDSLISSTEWQRGVVDSSITEIKDIVISDYTTVYSCLQEYIVGLFDAEISFSCKIEAGEVVGKFINVYSKRGNDEGYRFEYSSNVSSISKTCDSSDLVTALIGVGKDNITFADVEAPDKPLNQDFVSDDDSYRRWNANGSHIMGVFKCETESKQELLSLTRKELQVRKTPKIKYELKTEVLNYDEIEIGDTVKVVDHEFNPPLQLEARINELTISFTDFSKNECVLANYKDVTEKERTYDDILKELRDYLAGLETGKLNKNAIENIKKYLEDLNMTKEEIDKIFEDLKIPDIGDDDVDAPTDGDGDNNTGSGGGTTTTPPNTGTEIVEYLHVKYVTNVRETPALSGNVVGQAQPNIKYRIYERGMYSDGYEWLKIKFNGEYRYCAVVEGNEIKKSEVASGETTVYKGGLWIGDSITDALRNYGLIKSTEIGICAFVGRAAKYFLDNFNLITKVSPNPKYISILLGVNNPNDVSNMKKLLDKLLNTYPSTNIYVQAVLPVGQKYKSPYFESSLAYNKAITNYNAQMKAYCETNKYLIYCPNSTAGLVSNGYLKEGISSDHLHLNKDASQMLYDNIVKGITTAYVGNGGNVEVWKDGKMSSNCYRFMKGMEGFGKYAYQDSAGYWTIAYGVTAIGEKDVYEKLKAQTPLDETVGAKESYDILNKNYGKKILTAVKNLGCTNQNQFDALCSLAYNGGVGSVTLSNSLTNAIKRNPNDEAYIRPIWEKFKITSGGVVLAGLKTRRKNECNMFFGKSVEMRPIYTINANGSYGAKITANNGNGWLPDDKYSGSGSSSGGGSTGGTGSGGSGGTGSGSGSTGGSGGSTGGGSTGGTTGGTTGGSTTTKPPSGTNDILTTLQGEKQNLTLKDGQTYNCKTLKSLQFLLPSSPKTSYSSKLTFTTPKNTSPMIFKQSSTVWLTGDDCLSGALLPVADTKYEIVIKYNTNSTIPRRYRGSVKAVHGSGKYTTHSTYSGANKVIENAIDFYNNRDKFKYSTTTPISPFAKGKPSENKSKWYTGGKYHIDCSTFTNHLFKGRGYKNSIYKSTSTYGIGLSINFSYGVDLGRYAATQAETCVQNGWHLPIKAKDQTQWGNLKKGDLIFWSSRSSEGSRNETVSKRYMQVGHVGVVAKVTKNSSGKYDVYVYDVSTPKGTVLYRELKKNFPEKLLFFARVRK